MYPLQSPTGPSDAGGRTKQEAGIKPPNSTYLPFRISVSVLVLVPQGKLQWIMILNFLVGHFLTDTLGRHRSHLTCNTRPRTQPCVGGGQAEWTRVTGHFLGHGGPLSPVFRTPHLRRTGPLGTLNRGGGLLFVKSYQNSLSTHPSSTHPS